MVKDGRGWYGDKKGHGTFSKEKLLKLGKGWHGERQRHRDVKLGAGARKAMNTQMQKAQEGEKQLTIYWWNFGRKTLDFKGSYSDFLKLKGITITKITHPFQKDTKGLRFKIPVGSRLATLDTFDSNFYTNADDAIQVFLILLGDKTEFITAYGRERRLNWR